MCGISGYVGPLSVDPQRSAAASDVLRHRGPDGHGVFTTHDGSIKGLAPLAGVMPQINQDHLLRYLVNGYTSLYTTADTFFRKMEELPAKTFLRVVRDGAGSSQIYWSTDTQVDEALSYEDSVRAGSCAERSGNTR